MIRIGNQTAWSAATPVEPFDFALAHGFDAFEWFPDKKDGGGWDESDLDKSLRRDIRERARVCGLRLSVHARWQANPLAPDSAPLFRKDFGLARDLGAALVNIHLCAERGLSAYAQAVAPLVRHAAEAGLQLSIENTPYHSPEDFNEVFARLRGLNTPLLDHVGMCFDLGHANLCAATRNDYLRFLDRLDPRVPIIHCHFHENWGDADRHLTLFTGPAGRDDSGIRGLLDRLRRRNYSGSIILEQWPQPPALLVQARDRLLSLLNPQAPPPASAPQPSLSSSTATGILEDEDDDENGASRRVFAPGLRATVADPSGTAPGAVDFADALVTGDKRCRSWREKLDFVRGLLATGTAPLGTEQLVDVAIYLRFLGTGEIPCAEDGRHFRPAHHSRIALQIQERLAAHSGPDTAWIARRILPWLPSSARAFQRPEPLTRIRDLAHRNDIPAELKREIKHSLQNKLHRCAGPEDLATSAALLVRITRPGAGYPPDFVDQFRIFHEELKEFFNSRSLEEQLQALLPRVDAADAGLIRSFLRDKSGITLTEQLAAGETLTALRRRLPGLAKQHPDLEAHALLLADIGLEDSAFVLASGIINHLRAAGDAATWEFLPRTLLLTLANLALSGIDPEECRAIESELQAWLHPFDASDREQWLRLKASVERARRVAEDYCDRIQALFSRRAEKLGRALGVAGHAVRVFNDAEIRAHLVFQLSKLASALLRCIREQLAMPAWDVVVSGRAVGRVKAADSLDGLGRVFPEPIIALAQSAEGDEEIPRGIAGVVLAHEIPHLSHLGVRARQAGVVLVAGEEAANFQELRRLEGQRISLIATADKVEWRPAAAIAAAPAADRRARPRLPDAQLAADRSWIPLEQVRPANSGGKADGVRRLAELARRDGAGFKTPTALAIPFGAMESALRSAPALEQEYRELPGRLDGLGTADFEKAAGRLRELIGQLAVPGEIASAVTSHFGLRDRLIVRSSANAEDLEQLAGAGLYESIAGVAPAEVASAVRAVWASLWTRRAALSRREAGIPHNQAHMAVLVQRMLSPDLSFVLHTVNPVSHNPREVYAEIAVGLGETLASAAVRGSPFRLVIDKSSGAAAVLAFANFSRAPRPDGNGGWTREIVDYSRVPLSCDRGIRQRLGARLAAIGRLVEDAFRQPQDIEGALVGDEIHLVQARPQPGLPGPGHP